MYITIPQRGSIPSTEVFTKIIKKNDLDVLGSERDVIILIHGGPGGNHTLYSDIQDSLFEIADLILIDLRGCGLSQKEKSHFCTLEVHADDLKFIIESFGLKKPIIHGCSYGAIVALNFSLKYPSIPWKLILSSCVASSSFLTEAKENLKKIGTETQIEAAEKLWTGDFKNQEEFINYYKVMAPLYIYKHETNKDLPISKQSLPYNIDLVNFAFTTFLTAFDFSNDLINVQADTLILAGENDWIFDVSQAEIIHNGIKNSELVVLQECAHFPWKDQREKFLESIDLFIKNKFRFTSRLACYSMKY